MVHTRFYHKTFTEDGGKYNLCFEGKKYLKIRLHVENIYILMILFDHFEFKGTAVIRYLRPEFKFPAKIEMAFPQMLAMGS